VVVNKANKAVNGEGGVCVRACVRACVCVCVCAVCVCVCVCVSWWGCMQHF
jgi:hypothetical protein